MKSFEKHDQNKIISGNGQSNVKNNGLLNHLEPDTAHPYLTVIIPAYNEEKRLPETLDKIIAYLESRPYHSETIIVDDGSQDSTPALVQHRIANRPLEAQQKVNLKLQIEPHRGKGATVQAGILAGQGDYILFSDTDLSTPIDEIEKLLPFLENGHDVVIGSREGSGAQRYDEPFYRHLMGRVFNLLVRFSTGLNLQDTQCGFKAFRREAAHDLFRRVQLYNANSQPIKGAMVTGFDVEVLYLAHKYGYKIKEVPVIWYHIQGSKVNPIKDTLKMVRDIFNVRLNDWRGKYKD